MDLKFWGSLIGGGLLALGLGYLTLTVISWHSDSVRLPAVEKERDGAVASYNDLSETTTKKLNDAVAKMGQLQADMLALQKTVAANQHTIDARIEAQLRNLPNVSTTNSADDARLRDGLLKLDTYPRQKSGTIERRSESRPGAEMYGTAAVLGPVPGWLAAAEGQRGRLRLSVPARASQEYRGQARERIRRLGNSDRRLGQRSRCANAIARLECPLPRFAEMNDGR